MKARFLPLFIILFCLGSPSLAAADSVELVCRKGLSPTDPGLFLALDLSAHSVTIWDDATPKGSEKAYTAVPFTDGPALMTWSTKIDIPKCCSIDSGYELHRDLRAVEVTTVSSRSTQGPNHKTLLCVRTGGR
ncbi:MAG TPA: hypothetical protein HPP80_01275 [Rhodospirillaceae bacterium]|nr:hypothetical protein [Rhodospirillaceae bacterium]